MRNSKIIKFIVVIMLTGVFTVGAAACGGIPGIGNGGKLSYNEYPTNYSAEIDSWLQIHPDDEDVEVTWFTNYTYADYAADLIYKRTGVKLKYQSALTTDNSELNTMIAGDKLPDIVTISDLGTRVQMAEEGYAYAIDRLAESYAPSLLKRLTPEHKDYYSASDGHMYGIASNFYNDGDISEYDEMGAKQYMNYDVVVRKDYLEAFIAYKTSLDSNFNPDSYVTKPAGFLEMSKWVKSTYNLANSNPTICLYPFMPTATNDYFNYTLSALMELFCVPYEDSNGNYVYQYDTPEFIEVMEFLNTLYNEKLITSSNFSYSRTDIGTQILNGRPFALIGASQTQGGYFANYEKAGYNATTDTVADSNRYVSIVLTNSRGDAPLLMDYAGRGLYVTMITKNCKRVDRVIKVMDYMMSEQGQRELYYGETEGEYYSYKVRPGEINPDTNKVSTYGVMEWTDKAKDLLKRNNVTTLYNAGITRKTMITNILYTRITSGDSNYYGISWLQEWLEYNNKSAYFDYTFSRVPFRYPLDITNRIELNEYIDMQADIEAVWIEAYPKMIMASSIAAMRAIYDKALSDSYLKGANQWTAFRNRNFKEYKEYLNIQYAWPKADPSYVQPAVTLYGSTEKYAMERPEYISWVN